MELEANHTLPHLTNVRLENALRVATAPQLTKDRACLV